MKKTIKVYLQYPWIFPDSPYYKYLISSPSKGIEYQNISKQKGVSTNKKFIEIMRWSKVYFKKIVNSFFPSFPNSHSSPKGNYDLIHCAHCLSRNKDKPWVADIEFPGQLWLSGGIAKNKKRVRKLLFSNNCKKLIFWTKKMQEDFLREFSDLRGKCVVIYPSIPRQKIKKKNSGVNLIYTGRYFYGKGGLHALEVMDRLTKKYRNVSGVIVSSVPGHIRKKYSENKKIQIYDLMPQKKLFEIFSKSHIFIYPGYSDSFGFAIPEAMSFGVIPISADISNRNELIREGKTGFLIPISADHGKLIKLGETLEGPAKKIVSDFERKVEILIKDKKLRDKMSGECIREIEVGKFSLKKNNKKIKEIYRGALK
ncbi:MAG: glycosyltransferase family 4 protein [Nanoarchaeota archaeon]|nr:glycosyltransferase family 4 protein [Nanoarchaeota archaeon]